MTAKSETIEIRTFATMLEVINLAGYTENNAVNEKNYERIFGDYWFDPKEKCCRQKPNGELCNTEHNFGFVAKLKDGSVSIVGNCCAKDRFGADSSIRKDRSKYVNEKRRRDRLSQLSDILNEENAILRELTESNEKLKAIQARTITFVNSLEPQTIRRLQDMSKTGRSTIIVDAVTYHEHKDEDGYIDKERRVAPSRLGTINGISIFNEYSFTSISIQVREIKKAFEEAKEIENDVKTSELESLSSKINQYKAVKREVSNIELEEAAFYKNELLLLCYLVSDKSERYKTAQVVLERNGEKVGKSKAKQWLIDQDAALREQLKADKIEVQW